MRILDILDAPSSRGKGVNLDFRELKFGRSTTRLKTHYNGKKKARVPLDVLLGAKGVNYICNSFCIFVGRATSSSTSLSLGAGLGAYGPVGLGS